MACDKFLRSFQKLSPLKSFKKYFLLKLFLRKLFTKLFLNTFLFYFFYHKLTSRPFYFSELSSSTDETLMRDVVKILLILCPSSIHIGALDSFVICLIVSLFS